MEPTAPAPDERAPYIDPEYGPIDGFDPAYRAPKQTGGPVVKWLIGIIVVMVMLGMIGIVAVVGRPTAAVNPKCKGKIEQSMRLPDGEDHAVVLVDVPSNDDLDVRTIAGTVAAYLSDLAPDGARVELLYDFGVGTGITVDRCFDGTRSLVARKANRTNQERLQTALGAELFEQLSSQLRGQTVQPTGGPARLLRQAGRMGTDVTSWFLWSDLLANDGSCFDIGETEATPENATAAVNRCIDSRDLPSSDESTPPLTLHGAGESTRTGSFDGFAVNLEAAICKHLTCADR